jgi:hypothetical protein
MATGDKASGGKSRSTRPKSAKAGTGAKPVASDPVLGPLSRYKFGGLGGHSCRFVLQDFEEDPQPDEFRAAVRNALDAKPAILKAAEPHVVQYCMDALARYDDDDRPALVLEKPGDVWSHVQFGDEFIVRRRTVADAEHGVYLSLTCNCDWEPEHGLQLVLRDGRAITKIGEYDGHLTNADAYGDRALADVVYRRVGG